MPRTLNRKTFSLPKSTLLAAGSLLILAACGGSDTSSTSSSTQETAAAQPAEPTGGNAENQAAAMPASNEDSSASMSGDEGMDDMEMGGDMGGEEPTQTASAAQGSSSDAGTQTAEANGTVHEIQMLSRDPDNPREAMVFRPDLVMAKPGDTIRFVPTDPTHQSSSIDEMIPEGTEGWEGRINKAVEYVVPEPGVYGYKCVPHYAAGMVGLLVVEGEGMMDNVEEAKSVNHTGLAKRRFEDIWSRAEEQYLSGS